MLADLVARVWPDDFEAPVKGCPRYFRDMRQTSHGALYAPVPRATPSARRTPILEDFARRISPPTPRFQSLIVMPFDSD